MRGLCFFIGIAAAFITPHGEWGWAAFWWCLGCLSDDD